MFQDTQADIIRHSENDKKKLSKMLANSIEFIKHKIELEAVYIAGELVTMTEGEVENLIINKLEEGNGRNSKKRI